MSLVKCYTKNNLMPSSSFSYRVGIPRENQANKRKSDSMFCASSFIERPVKIKCESVSNAQSGSEDVKKKPLTSIQFVKRTEAEEDEILYIYQKKQLSEEDRKYLHTKYRLMESESMAKNALLPWEKMGLTSYLDNGGCKLYSLKSPEKLTVVLPNSHNKKTRSLASKTKEIKFKQILNSIYGRNLLAFADPELSNVLPHNAGCSRGLDYMKMRDFYHQLKSIRNSLICQNNFLFNQPLLKNSSSQSASTNASPFLTPNTSINMPYNQNFKFFKSTSTNMPFCQTSDDLSFFHTSKNFINESKPLLDGRKSLQLSPKKNLLSSKFSVNFGQIIDCRKNSILQSKRKILIGVISPVKNISISKASKCSNSNVEPQCRRKLQDLDNIFEHQKMSEKAVKLSKSPIHGWGLFAMEFIPADCFVIEYRGEKIRSSVADVRELKYEMECGSNESSFNYLFRVDPDHVIDATKKGNFARFINHSCTPNCIVKRKNVDGEYKLNIYSKRDINYGEEITYNYKFSKEPQEMKIECLCGSSGCRRWLN